MSARRPIPWQPLLLILVIGTMAAVWWMRLSAPAPVQQVRLDDTALADADSTARWGATRAPYTAGEIPAAVRDSPLPEADPLNISPELGRIWSTVLAYEQHRLETAPKPLATSEASRRLLSAVQELAVDYQTFSAAYQQVGAEHYARAIDDWYPSFIQEQIYKDWAESTKQLAFHQTDRTTLTAAYLHVVEAVANNYERSYLRALTDREATSAAFRAGMEAELAQLNADWDAELDHRLEILAAQVAVSREPVPTPPSLLEPVPPVRETDLLGEYRALVARHAEKSDIPPPASVLEASASETETVRQFWTDYDSIRTLRTDAALAAQGYERSSDGPDVTTQIRDLLFPQAERSDA